MTERPAARATRPDDLPLQLMLTVWLPFACTYFVSYALRNVNAVLAPELTRELDLSAADLGLLTSAYLIAFALAQLPAGILLDRYGPRRVVAILLLVAALGCLLHAFGRGFPEIILGRALIGVGMSVCLMGAVKCFAQWLPMARLPLATSLLLAFGGMGAMAAAGPVGWALDYVAWRVVFSILAALLVVASAFLYLVIPDRGEAGARDSLAVLVAGFGPVLRSGTFWRLSLMMVMTSGTYTAVHSLWIGPWLRDVGQFERGTTVELMTWFAFAATMGFVVIGSICDWLIRRGVPQLALYKFQTGASIVFFALILTVGGSHALPLWFGYFAIGSGGSFVLAILARTFSAKLTGRVNTTTNVLVFAFSFVAQWGIGIVLDQWPVVDGHYAVEGYNTAFAILLAMQLVVFAVVLIGERPSVAHAAARPGREHPHAGPDFCDPPKTGIRKK